uniref:Uncharacterized protein n=1 Tax=Rhizophora mucronata TaxID=61149 RepID=A0A2P2JNT7_RHIMU
MQEQGLASGADDVTIHPAIPMVEIVSRGDELEISVGGWEFLGSWTWVEENIVCATIVPICLCFCFKEICTL